MKVKSSSIELYKMLIRKNKSYTNGVKIRRDINLPNETIIRQIISPKGYKKTELIEQGQVTKTTEKFVHEKNNRETVVIILDNIKKSGKQIRNVNLGQDYYLQEVREIGLNMQNIGKPDFLSIFKNSELANEGTVELYKKGIKYNPEQDMLKFRDGIFNTIFPETEQSANQRFFSSRYYESFLNALNKKRATK